MENENKQSLNEQTAPEAEQSQPVTEQTAPEAEQPQPAAPQVELKKPQPEAPQAELLDYAIALRTMTQARGVFEMEFSKYEEVPSNIAQKIIDDYKKEQEAK